MLPFLILSALKAPVQATATKPAASLPAADLECDRAGHGIKGDTDRARLHPTALLQTVKSDAGFH